MTTPPARHRRRRAVRGAMLVVGGGGVAVGVGGVLARTFAVAWQPAVVAAAASVYLALAALVGGVLLALRRDRAGPLIAAAVVVWTVVVHVPLYVASPPRAGVTVVALQANVRVGGVDAAALVDEVRAHRVDVLTVDELTPDALARFASAGLDTLLPHRFVAPYPGGAGTGIWSRLPLGDTVRHDEFDFELLTARVEVPGATPVAVVAVHLLPPWPYPVSTWLREVGALRGVLDRLGSTSSAVIVSGDFNAGLDNPQLRGLLRGGFHDATDQAGGGFAPTYPTDRGVPPLLVLDHVLLRGADAASSRTVPLPGSDHRGLLVTVRVPAAGRR